MFTENQKIITHGEDVDGIIAASLYLRLVRPDSYKILPATYRNYQKVLQDVKANASDYICVLDLDANSSVLRAPCENTTLIRALACGSFTYWIDHHKATRINAQFLAKNGVVPITSLESIVESTRGRLLNIQSYINPTVLRKRMQRASTWANIYPECFVDLCTSALVEMMFNKTNCEYSKWLAGHAQVHDFSILHERCPDTYRLTKRLQKIITYYNFKADVYSLVRLIEIIAKGANWLDVQGKFIDHLDKALTEYGLEANKSWQDLRQNQCMMEFDELKFLFSIASTSIYSKDTIRFFINDYKEPIHAALLIFKSPIGFGQDSALFFKGTIPGYDCVPFCTFLGGGGRDGDGGFTIPTKVTAYSLSDTKKWFRQKMHEFFCNYNI